MKKKGGRILNHLKLILMKNEFGVIELTKNELIECNGGMVMLIIGLFLPNFERFVDFVEGAKEGYERATNA
jgi:hypothetical protein